MKQRHSYTNLLFHVVMRTKHREHFIFDQEERAIETYMKKKARELDAWVEELGAWNDHVHLLLRTRPTHCLSEVYGQLKGFCAWSLRKRSPDTAFGWSDGVYAVTVDPDNCDALRAYIRNQRNHHEEEKTQPKWELEDSAADGPIGEYQRAKGVRAGVASQEEPGRGPGHAGSVV